MADMGNCNFIIRRDPMKDLTHWKYLKKVKKNGKWRYYYDKESLKSDVKNKIETKFKDGVKAVNDVYNNPDNIYDVNSLNYNEKIKQIENSKEWQDIVRRQDPEYVRRNADGTVTYLIDDYLTKKKHPELDILDDISSGRPLTVNKIDKYTVVAGGKDYIHSKVKLLSMAIVSLTELFKYQQGSYKEEEAKAVQTVKDTIDTGKLYVSTLNNTVDTYEKYVNTVNNTKSDTERYQTAVNKTVDTAAKQVYDITKEKLKDKEKYISKESEYYKNPRVYR